MNFVKLGERYINTEQIASLTIDGEYYNIRMSNADFYLVKIDKNSKKLMEGILNAELQLSSERATKRTNRNI